MLVFFVQFFEYCQGVGVEGVVFVYDDLVVLNLLKDFFGVVSGCLLMSLCFVQVEVDVWWYVGYEEIEQY